MNQRLVDIKEDLDQKELQAKIASVQEVWGDNETALELLCDAMTELEKQASDGSFGDSGLTGSQMLSLGVQYAERVLTELAKEAEAQEETETKEVEETVEKEAEADEEVIDEALEEEMHEKYALAYELGGALGAIGITSEDIEKLAEAGEEETDDFCRLLSHLSAVEIDDEA